MRDEGTSLGLLRGECGVFATNCGLNCCWIGDDVGVFVLYVAGDTGEEVLVDAGEMIFHGV